MALNRIIPNGVSRLRYWFPRSRITCKCENRIKDKVVVLTGATSGIGFYTALDLAKKGSVLYLACRNDEKGEKTVSTIRDLSSNKNVKYLHLDLSKLSTIQDFVVDFQKQEDKLDVLINNAGVFHHPSYLTEDGFEITYQTNFLGVLMLTTLLHKSILKAQSSRIIFVSSEAHRAVSIKDLLKFEPKKKADLEEFTDYIELYGISKLALNVYATRLCEEVPGSVITLVNPGNVWTDIYRNCWLSREELATRIKCSLLMRLPEEGAQSSIHAVCAPPEVVKSKYISDTLVSEALADYGKEVSEDFLMKSKKLVGL